MVFDADRALGRYLADVLRGIGYRPALRVLPELQRFDAAYRVGPTTNIVPYGWGADYPSPSGYLAAILGCSAAHPAITTNTGGFCDPNLEAQIQRALALQPTRPAESARLWQQVDRAGVDLAATLPLGLLAEDVITSARVGNYQHQPVYGVLYDQLWVR
jgi:peptide/nickel transport system substrate-binding protein